jgi:hypothetical protein
LALGFLEPNPQNEQKIPNKNNVVNNRFFAFKMNWPILRLFALGFLILFPNLIHAFQNRQLRRLVVLDAKII